MFVNKRISKFKTIDGDSWLKSWNQDALRECSLTYELEMIQTSFGNTWIHHKNHGDKNKLPLVFIPGFRTCGLFWDLNNSLKKLYNNYRIYLIDVIGQPSLSDRSSPPIKTNQYALWIQEVLDGLDIEKCILSGASFGGLLTLKVANHIPDRIMAACYFNPVGFQFINIDIVSMYRSLKPLIFPSLENIQNFLYQSVIGTDLTISDAAKKQLIIYQHYVIKNFKFGSDYPYKVNDKEIEKVTVPSYFFLCHDDELIKQCKTDKRVKDIMPGYKETFFFSNIGHAIEFSHEAMNTFQEMLTKEYS